MANKDQQLEELIETIKAVSNYPEYLGILKRNGHKWNRGLPSLDYYDNQIDHVFGLVKFNKYYR